MALIDHKGWGLKPLIGPTVEKGVGKMRTVCGHENAGQATPDDVTAAAKGARLG